MQMCRVLAPRPILLLATTLLVFALNACGSSPSPAGDPFCSPDALGPFTAGHTTFSIVDAGREGRELPVDAWYPVDPEDAAGQPTVYEVAGFTLESEIALQALPVSSARRFPLVVFSHGSGGIRFQSIFLTERMATHGFIVVAPDHVGNTLLDDLLSTSLPMVQMSAARPLDVSFLITRMLEKTADPGDPFYRAVDPERIGVCGHSFGGFTSLAMAAGFGADPPDEVASELPEDFQPVAPDTRVRAVVPVAPVSSFFGDGELQAVRVPTMIIGGTLDTTTPIQPESARPFELIPRQVFRADIERAVHFSFTNSCDLIQVMSDQGIPLLLILLLLGPDFVEPCGPGVLEIEEAQRLTNLYAVSHFKRFLNGDARYDRFLTESHAREVEPNVSFFAKPD